MGGAKAAQQAFTHPQRVRLLYKTILKLHRGMPLELQALGDQYARDEFKRHKDANAEHTKTFMMEWTNYAITLAKQLGLRGAHTARSLGKPIEEPDLDKFNDEQIYQLYELHEAAKVKKAEDSEEKAEK
ncbi:succinate dehydrogenase assembly factor 3, mitochondrial-like [Palaemon carinicauda]|uniref:succinate dehydrogenase assembly factor 3, mitochondrial-like n=1 Tax=Palaemon carinicauda TaxID=392227 RepID=UPI0035B5F922